MLSRERPLTLEVNGKVSLSFQPLEEPWLRKAILESHSSRKKTAHTVLTYSRCSYWLLHSYQIYALYLSIFVTQLDDPLKYYLKIYFSQKKSLALYLLKQNYFKRNCEAASADLLIKMLVDWLSYWSSDSSRFPKTLVQNKCDFTTVAACLLQVTEQKMLKPEPVGQVAIFDIYIFYILVYILHF